MRNRRYPASSVWGSSTYDAITTVLAALISSASPCANVGMNPLEREVVQRAKTSSSGNCSTWKCQVSTFTATSYSTNQPYLLLQCVKVGRFSLQRTRFAASLAWISKARTATKRANDLRMSGGARRSAKLPTTPAMMARYLEEVGEEEGEEEEEEEGEGRR